MTEQSMEPRTFQGTPEHPSGLPKATSKKNNKTRLALQQRVQNFLLLVGADAEIVHPLLTPVYSPSGKLVKIYTQKGDTFKLFDITATMGKYAHLLQITSSDTKDGKPGDAYKRHRRAILKWKQDHGILIHFMKNPRRHNRWSVVSVEAKIEGKMVEIDIFDQMGIPKTPENLLAWENL